MIQSREELTTREREQMQYEKEMFLLQAEHTQKIKAMEYEVAKLEARWSTWLRLPRLIILSPFILCVGIAYAISVAVKKPLPVEDIYKLVK